MMNISNMIDNNRTTQSSAVNTVDNGSRQMLEKSEQSQSCGCPFAGKHEHSEPKEENTIADLLQAISNILRRLLS